MGDKKRIPHFLVLSSVLAIIPEKVSSESSEMVFLQNGKREKDVPFPQSSVI